MRLIDADALVKEIEKNALEAEQQVHGRRSGKTLAKGILFGLGAARKIILDQPTAYDLDKVVEQLSCNECGTCELRDVCNDNMLDVFMTRICEIIKRGGVDGN